MRLVTDEGVVRQAIVSGGQWGILEDNLTNQIVFNAESWSLALGNQAKPKWDVASRAAQAQDVSAFSSCWRCVASPLRRGWRTRRFGFVYETPKDRHAQRDGAI